MKKATLIPQNVQTRLHRSKVVLLATSLSAALLLILLAALRPLSPIQAAGNVYCVVPAGSPAGPFAACDQVFTSVQTAVDSAGPESEVWIAAGVYTDVHTINGRSQIVLIDKSLTLRGGYTPPFSSPPDPDSHIARLDAQGAGRVVFVTGPVSVTVAGLYLTGGQAGLGQSGSGLYAAGGQILLQDNAIYDNQLNTPTADSDLDFGLGGGVYVTNSQAVLIDNTIHDNVGYGAACGGGVAASASDVTLRHNTVSSNTASLPTTAGSFSFAIWGGGLCLTDSQVTLIDNDIYANVARQAAAPDNLTLSYGGGLVLFNSSGTVEGNRIVGNRAGEGGHGLGGGVFIQDSPRVTLTGNLVQDNVASGRNFGSGGGIAALAPTNPQSAVILHANRIVSNTAVISGAAGYGGGVFLATATMTLTHNVILSNTALMTGTTGQGGGLLLGNAAHLFMGHNRIAGNAAALSGSEGFGAGLYLATSSAFLTGNVIAQNYGGSAGGGLLLDGGQVRLENTAVIDNQGSGLQLICGAQVDAWHTTLARNENSALQLSLAANCEGEAAAPSTAVFTNTILASHAVGAFVSAGSSLALHGILWHDTPLAFQLEPGALLSTSWQYTGDPLFAADGYHITANSAARFKGLDTVVRLDIDGQGRPLASPDLGADEYWLVSWYLPIVTKSENSVGQASGE